MPGPSKPPGKSSLTTESMTILFCDIKNYTQMSPALHSWAGQTLLQTYLDEMSALIKKHHGTIDKILGDGILALFGQPSPADHHARDAVACALEMQESICAQRPQWRKLDEKLDLEVRTGIATGDVLVGDLTVTGHRNYTALGSTVNLAFRLQEKSRPGSILISEDTYLQIHHAFACQNREGLELKGFEDSYDAYEVRGRSPLPPEPSLENSSTTPRALEQRRTTRKELTLDIEYSINGTFGVARSLNVSEGGIFLSTPELQPIGTTLALYASIPTDRGILPLVVQGRIVRHGRTSSGPGMGIQFSSIEASDLQTLRYFIKSIYGLPSKTPRVLPETEEVHVTELLDPASTCGLPGLSPKELGCGDPAALNTRLTHEFHRTKRYNHEFSCIALRVTHLGSEEGLEEALRLLSEEIRGSVRNTDEVFYLNEGVFVILAPETMKNRVHTLSGRVTRNLLGVIEKKGFKSNDLEFKCGTFSFDGRNAKTHNDVLAHALDECLYSSLNSVM